MNKMLIEDENAGTVGSVQLCQLPRYFLLR